MAHGVVVRMDQWSEDGGANERPGRRIGPARVWKMVRRGGCLRREGQPSRPRRRKEARDVQVLNAFYNDFPLSL